MKSRKYMQLQYADRILGEKPINNSARELRQSLKRTWGRDRRLFQMSNNLFTEWKSMPCSMVYEINLLSIQRQQSNARVGRSTATIDRWSKQNRSKLNHVQNTRVV